MRRLLIALATTLVTVVLMSGSASAIAQYHGPNDDTGTTSINPDGGANPAHGPSCGQIFDCDNSSPNPGGPNGEGTTPPGLDAAGLNVGAWNAYFQTRETNTAICGIWATNQEAIDANEPVAIVNGWTCEEAGR